MKLKGKVGLITGSSSGIGEAIAVKLASIGVNVVITGRDDSRIANVVKECVRVSGLKAIGVKADIIYDNDIQKLVDKTIEVFDKIDILDSLTEVFSAELAMHSPLPNDQTSDQNHLGRISNSPG